MSVWADPSAHGGENQIGKENITMKLCELMEETSIQGDVRLSVWDSECNEVAISEIMGITNSLGEYELKKAKRTITFYGENKKIPSVLKWAEYEITYIFCPGDGFLHIELKPSNV